MRAPRRVLNFLKKTELHNQLNAHRGVLIFKGNSELGARRDILETSECPIGKFKSLGAL